MNCLSLSRPSQWIRLLVVLTAFFMALVGLAKDATEVDRGRSTLHAASNSDASAKGKAAAANGAPNPENRLREGSKIVNELGTFEDTGDVITFTLSETKVEIKALENLALERIAHVLDETSTARIWSVSGTLTEYQGNNFLFVTRAVLKAKGAVSAGRTAAVGR